MTDGSARLTLWTLDTAGGESSGSLPAVSFSGTPLANRVITTTPPGISSPVLEWFNKYVVTTVTQTNTVGGGVGAGKSTIVAHLAQLLAAAGEEVHVTAEPSNGPIGSLCLELTGSVTGHALACLYAADRYHHVASEIRPRMEDGLTVISDRYIPSGLVMQRFDGIDLAFLWQLSAEAYQPDLAVILEADPEGHCRTAARTRAAQPLLGELVMDLMTTQALNDLRLHRDEAYKITYHPGEAEPCHAERLDDGTPGQPSAVRAQWLNQTASATSGQARATRTASQAAPYRHKPDTKCPVSIIV